MFILTIDDVAWAVKKGQSGKLENFWLLIGRPWNPKHLPHSAHDLCVDVGRSLLLSLSRVRARQCPRSLQPGRLRFPPPLHAMIRIPTLPGLR